MMSSFLDERDLLGLLAAPRGTGGLEPILLKGRAVSSLLGWNGHRALDDFDVVKTPAGGGVVGHGDLHALASGTVDIVRRN